MKGNENGGGHVIHGKHPAVASDVPPQFVVLSEKTNLPVGEKDEFVLVFTVIKKMIGATEIDPGSIRSFIRVPGLRLAITPDRDNAEFYAELVAQPVFVAGREITVDTAPDALALSSNTDGFRNGQCSIFVDPDI